MPPGHSLELLELGHRILQSPQVGLKSVSLLPKERPGSTTLESLGSGAGDRSNRSVTESKGERGIYGSEARTMATEPATWM